MSRAFGYELYRAYDPLALGPPSVTSGSESTLSLSPHQGPDSPNDAGCQHPCVARCVMNGSPERVCTCPTGNLAQALLECQQLAVERGHLPLGENRLLSIRTISNIVESYPSPIKPLSTQSAPRLPSNGVDPADSYILPKYDFEAYQYAVNVEVTELRRKSLKCVLADPRAIGKSFETCREEADKHIQRQLDVTENAWRASNPTALFVFETENAEKTAEVCQSEYLPAGSGFEDATLRQYGCLTSGMTRQMLASKEVSQVPQTKLLGHVNRAGMRKHLEILRQWNAEWQRRADNSINLGNRFWHCGPITIDLRNCEETYYHEWEEILSRTLTDAAALGTSRERKPRTACKASKEDEDAIDKLAVEMTLRTSQEDKAMIRVAMGGTARQQGKKLARRDIDPPLCFFRTQAVKEYCLRTKESTDKEGQLVGHESEGEPQSQTQSKGQSRRSHLAHRALLGAIAIPNGARARAEPESGKVFKPRGSKTGASDSKPSREIADSRRMIQKLPTLGQEEAKISSTWRKTSISRANPAASGSQIVEFKDTGNGFTTSPSVDEMGTLWSLLG